MEELSEIWFKENRFNFQPKNLITLDKQILTSIFSTDEYLYVGTKDGSILKFYEDNNLEYKIIETFKSSTEKPITQLRIDQQFSTLFFKDSEGITILNSSNLQIKKEFNDDKCLRFGVFSSQFTQFHHDVNIRNNEGNQLSLFNSETKEILIYKYTESSFEYQATYPLNIDANYIFNIGNLVVGFDRKYKTIKCGKITEDINVDALGEIEPSSCPKIMFISNKYQKIQKDNSFIVYYVNDEKIEPIYLEDEGIHKMNKFYEMKFSSKIEYCSISFPFIVGISKKKKDFILEIKSVYNENKPILRDKYKSTADAIPIEFSGTSFGLTSSFDAFYYFLDNSIFKISLPSPDDLGILLKKDGLIKPARQLKKFKNLEMNSNNIKNSDFMKFKSMIKFNNEMNINESTLDDVQFTKVLSSIHQKKEISIPKIPTVSIEKPKDVYPTTPKSSRKTRSRNVLIIKNPQMFTKKRRNSSLIVEQPEPKTPTENLSYILKPTEEKKGMNISPSPVVAPDSEDEEVPQHRIGRMKSSFSALEEGELSIKKGELMVILQDESDGWTLIFYKKKQGFVPSHFIFELDFKAFQKRKEIVKEFIETEETYVTNLIHLNHYFCVPLQKILSKKTHQALFSNLQTVLSLNGLFLVKLQEIAKKDYILQDDELSLILLEFSGSFRLYTEYIVSFENMNNIVLKEGSKNSKFEKFVKEKKVELKSKGLLCDVGSYLILPVQRLPRYRLLLSDLVRYSPKEENPKKFDQLKRALDDISKVVNYCNEKIREYENAQELVALQKKYDLITSKSKKLIRSMKNEENFELLLNGERLMKSFDALVVLNDKIFIRPKKENLLQSTLDIFFPFFENSEILKVNITNSFILKTGKETLKFVFHDEKSFSSWLKTFEEMTFGED
eukprot:gene11379-4546_t